jgi:shikimate dehydrogenase
MILGDTKLCGIIGCPVSHSASPRMHAAAYKALGLNWTYVPFPVEPRYLESALKGLVALGVKGVNVTIPYKEAVIPLLHELSPEAQRMGSVNTIVNHDGHLVGHSTDGAGFILSLEREAKISPQGQSVFLIGAGGSARSIAFALADAGISELWISNRTRYRADALTHDIKSVFPHITVATVDERSVQMSHALEESRIVINTSPLGMAPNEDARPLDVFDWVTHDHWVCDIIYKPYPTRWLMDVQARGANILGGAGMLAGQGILAFQLFTGLDVDYDIMRGEV